VTAPVYLGAVAVGSALIGLWLCVRMPGLTPKTALGAVACFAAAWIVPGFGAPLLIVAQGHLRIGPAIFVSVFPVLTAAFALTAAGLNYLAGLAGHAVR